MFWRRRREEATFHSPKKWPASADARADERRWKEALVEAEESTFEVFEDRGPGVAAPPAGLGRRDH